MRRYPEGFVRRVALVVLSTLATACTETSATDASPSTGETLTFETASFEVGEGDVFECFYTDTITDRELDVYAAEGHQGPGGHHVMVFYTNDVHTPTHHPCVDSEMVNWNMVAGAAGSGDGVLSLEDNLSNRVPKGAQMVIQAHYINTTGKPFTTKDAITLKLRKPRETADYVNYFAVFDGSFQIPPQTKYTSTTECTVADDLQLVLSLGHMHERGKHFRLDVLDASGAVAKTLRDDAWSPEYTSHPPLDRFPASAPLVLTKGTVLRQTCDWDNEEAKLVEFPTEMCVGFFYYFPGTGDKVCAALPKP